MNRTIAFCVTGYISCEIEITFARIKLRLLIHIFFKIKPFASKDNNQNFSKTVFMNSLNKVAFRFANSANFVNL
jgi:hypothetical protein